MSIKKGIGYSPLSDTVYIGKQNSVKRMWVGPKEDITNEFLAVAFEYFPENTVREISTGTNLNLIINIRKNPKSIQKIIDLLNKDLAELTATQK